jgi:hypothetical protein
MNDLTMLFFGFEAGYLTCLGVGIFLRAYKDPPDDKK